MPITLLTPESPATVKNKDIADLHQTLRTLRYELATCQSAKQSGGIETVDLERRIRPAIQGTLQWLDYIENRPALDPANITLDFPLTALEVLEPIENAILSSALNDVAVLIQELYNSGQSINQTYGFNEFDFRRIREFTTNLQNLFAEDGLFSQITPSDAPGSTPRGAAGNAVR